MEKNNGLSLKTQYHDDASESKSFEGICDSSNVEPVERPLKIRVGYDIDALFGVPYGKTMKQKQTIFNEIMPQFLVTNVTEFKQAIIDGSIIAEKIRIDDVARVVSDNDISTGDTPEKRQRWGLAQKYLRRQRPNIHVFIDRKPGDRMYIMGSGCGEWHWGGFFDVLKIDFPELYKNALRTEQHARNLEGLCGAIAGAI
jgi:hypothetical protein